MFHRPDLPAQCLRAKQADASAMPSFSKPTRTQQGSGACHEEANAHQPAANRGEIDESSLQSRVHDDGDCADGDQLPSPMTVRSWADL